MRHVGWLTCILFVLLGCGAIYRDEVRDDGKSWKLTILAHKRCFVDTPLAACEAIFKPYLAKRASRLCGGPVSRLDQCKKVKGEGRIGIACVAACGTKDSVLDPVVSHSAPSGTTTVDFEKAKKCQARNGVWVNDTCQIEIDD